MLDKEGFEQAFSNPELFGIIVELAPESKKDSDKGKKDTVDSNLENQFTLLLLKSLQDEIFKNGHFLDFVRHINHTLNLGKKKSALSDFNRKIAKELLKNRVEWEGGVYTAKLSDLRSFLLDQSQRNQAQELLDQIF